MKYSSRLFLGDVLINVCIVFFSVVGMVIAALLIKMFSAMLSLMFNDHFGVSLNEIFFVMNLGSAQVQLVVLMRQVFRMFILV